jgi:hypothetical protein
VREREREGEGEGEGWAAPRSTFAALASAARSRWRSVAASQ